MHNLSAGLGDSFQWINDQKPAVKEAVLPSDGELTASGRLRNQERFHFLRLFK